MASPRQKMAKRVIFVAIFRPGKNSNVIFILLTGTSFLMTYETVDNELIGIDLEKHNLMGDDLTRVRSRFDYVLCIAKTSQLWISYIGGMMGSLHCYAITLSKNDKWNHITSNRTWLKLSRIPKFQMQPFTCVMDIISVGSSCWRNSRPPCL